MTAKTLMIQGTTSDAGKSTLVTGLCRVLKNRGIRVAPLKPQNMALNSAITIDGGEIGRAQAVQAQACGLQAHTDFNPVLIKPNSDTTAQIIIHGKARHEMDAIEYHQYKSIAMSAVLESHKRLCDQYDVILVEGAGSPAEINLRDRDIANMGFAEEVDCPVLLIADIDKGGVFAHLTGTINLLEPSEQNRIKGFVINKFRGDISLLESGLDWLEEYTQKKVMGVFPYIKGLHIEAEDALNTHSVLNKDNHINVIVPALPRISNHTDFDPLRLHPNFNFEYIPEGRDIPPCDLVILPGSKNVRSDLEWLKKNNWTEYLSKHLRYGGKLLGICGGFQMLGHEIHDPLGIEGNPGSSNAFGFIDMNTSLHTEKKLLNKSGILTLNNKTISGYEIHAGISEGNALKNPLIKFDDCTDGAISADNKIIGTYLHGLFDSEGSCEAFLDWCDLKHTTDFNYNELREKEIDRLATTLEENLDMNDIMELIS